MSMLRTTVGLDASAIAIAPDTVQRRRVRQRRIAASGLADATRLIGPIAKGEEISGVTNGQFSLIDILEHVLDCIGPAEVVISTWTMGVYDMEHAAAFYADRRITRIRWLVDPSMFGRRPALAGSLVNAFGADAFRAVNTHAKFATLTNDEWAVTIRSSMNLNRNERLESFDITEDRELHDFYAGIVDRVFATVDAQSRSQAKAFFDSLLADYELERHDTGIRAGNMRSLADLTRNLRRLPA